jgi:hypothetical protein
VPALFETLHGRLAKAAAPEEVPRVVEAYL